jgi:hypothetical protein
MSSAAILQGLISITDVGPLHPVAAASSNILQAGQAFNNELKIFRRAGYLCYPYLTNNIMLLLCWCFARAAACRQQC